TTLPENRDIQINPDLPFFLYHFYNLDPFWKKEIPANRILLMEPSHFKKYPVSEKSIQFVLELAKNIKNVQVFTGEWDELIQQYQPAEIHYKEHPAFVHYSGIQWEGDWMFPEVTG